MKVDKPGVCSSASALGTSRLDVRLQEARQSVKEEHCIGSPIGRSRISAACRSGLTLSSRLVVLLVMLGLGQSGVLAQIVPDGTLGSESSSLTPSLLGGDPRFPVTLIQGGALRGSYLFHSFSDFSINQGRAYFANPADVTTIFARITGHSISNINASLGVDGKASLVIINPNGIVLGPSMGLGIKSDFTATTVESIKFGDNVTFSAVEPKTIPEIAFNAPFGIQLGQVKPGVQVDNLRGDILVQANILLSTNITLISEGDIDTSRSRFGRDTANSLDRVLNRSGGAKNNIYLEAKGNIKTGTILSLNSITIISHEGYIDTTNGRLATQVGTKKSDTTNRGNISLTANDKIIAGSIKAGGVSIYGSDYLIVDKLAKDKPYPQEFDFFRSGDIKMTAPYIEIIEGANISTSNDATLIRSLSDRFDPDGVVPGDITIKASKSLVIGGVDQKGNSGGLFSESVQNSFTLAGAIKISTGNLVVNNSGVISIRSASEIQMDKAQMALADRANIKIDADSVVLQNGGKITTSTSRFSNSGSIEINAKDGILLSGKDTGLFANTEVSSSGIGGDIRINPNSSTPGSLTIQDGAGISVNSRGSGAGGSLDINAKSLTLNNNAFLSSETDRTNGGNLNLNVDGTLLLRHNSVISTSAGTAANASAVGKGGDLNINARFIVAPPYENSDIKANAFSGNGGTVNINTQKAFGIRTRSRDDLIRLLNTTDPNQLDPDQLPTSDITAISQNNPTLSGTVALAELSVDPTRGLEADPLIPTNPAVSEDCASQNQTQGSRVISSGRGGITPTPSDPLTGSAIWQESDSRRVTRSISPPESILPIAQGWTSKDSQTVVLVGKNTPKTTNIACHAR
jgi:filamentous hemagglutinin family protein